MSGRRIPIPPPAAPRLMHRISPQRFHVQHEDPLESFPEGEVQNPEACWFQHPDAPKITRFYKPERQWGDRFVGQVSNDPNGPPLVQPTGQLIDLKLQTPAVVSVRLSSVAVGRTTPLPTTDCFVRWTLDIGCGRSLQIVTFEQQAQPVNAVLGTSTTDVQLQLPINALRISAEIVDVFVGIGTPTFNIECVAMAAPFTSYPEMIAR